MEYIEKKNFTILTEILELIVKTNICSLLQNTFINRLLAFISFENKSNIFGQ